MLWEVGGMFVDIAEQWPGKKEGAELEVTGVRNNIFTQ
jgi:hypothetical protein